MIKLVENWKESPKWISFWCFSAIAAGHSAFLFLSPETQASILAHYGPQINEITAFLAFLGFFGRYIDQGPPPK